MTRVEYARLNAFHDTLEAALEAEEHRLATELFYLRRALDNSRRCRQQLNAGTTPTKKDQVA